MDMKDIPKTQFWLVTRFKFLMCEWDYIYTSYCTNGLHNGGLALGG